MVPLPLGCISRRLLRPRIRIVRSFFQCVCELVHTCAGGRAVNSKKSRCEHTHHCTVIVDPTGHNTSGARAMPPLTFHVATDRGEVASAVLTSRLDVLGVVY